MDVHDGRVPVYMALQYYLHLEANETPRSDDAISKCTSNLEHARCAILHSHRNAKRS